MVKRIGRRQGRTLRLLANPDVAGVLPPNGTLERLKELGLVEELPDQPLLVRITPDGLRALADWTEREREE